MQMKRLSLTAVIITTTLATTGFAKDYPEPSQSSIKMLLQNPNIALGFDSLYGDGKAKEILEANGIKPNKTFSSISSGTSKAIQTANEVIPNGKFISKLGSGFVMTHKGKVYRCYLSNSRVACRQNPD